MTISQGQEIITIRSHSVQPVGSWDSNDILFLSKDDDHNYVLSNYSNLRRERAAHLRIINGLVLVLISIELNVH